MATEWAVELRPTELDRMVGQEVNREIISQWIKDKTLPTAVIFYGRSGTGKALKNGTGVLTPTGYRPIETLRVGDKVASNDGKFYSVTGVFPQGKKQCYEVSLGHGHTITASADHIWTVSRDFGKSFHDETTQEILDKGFVYIEPKTGWSHHLVVLPAAQPIEFPEANLPVDPYLLGALIGDGSLHSNFGFSSADEFIINKVNSILQRDHGCELCKVNSSRAGSVDYHIAAIKKGSKVAGIFRGTIEGLGLAVSAQDKVIPEQYLYSSIEQRRALLAGLMDTDGYVDSHGMADFTSVSEKLIRQVEFIAESLGIVTRTRYNIPNWYTVKDSHIRMPARPASSIIFYTFDTLSTLPRKVRREQEKKSRQVRNQIRFFDIKPVGECECTCISIDAPNHLYLTEHAIPTHNTTSARALAKAFDAELVELDAASHNGVDDARQINEQAARLSLLGKRKIFLIDEAHRLSGAAWDALLKSIEEPNSLTTFIFATTDYSKLPLTIRGRSRMLKFYSIPDAQLKEYALEVLNYKGFSLKDEVIDLIVRQAHGQVRDLLKLLQTACEGNLNDLAKIKKFLAIPDNGGMRNFINAVLAPLPKNGIAIINNLSTDLLEWVRALQAHIYELLEDKYGVRELVADDATKEKARALASKFSDRQFGALLTALNKIQNADTVYAQLYALLFNGVEVNE